jgi:hypothetical protein
MPERPAAAGLSDGLREGPRQMSDVTCRRLMFALQGDIRA